MELLLVPLIGPFHLTSPAYNSVTVSDLLAGWRPEMVLTTALSPSELSSPAWQATPEIALPLAVSPWARRNRVPFSGVGTQNPEPGAQEAFRRYLQPFPEASARFRGVDALLGPVEDLLKKPLTLTRVQREVVPALQEHLAAMESEFGDGPATDWLRRRLQESISRVLEAQEGRIALLAPVDHLPVLIEELSPAAEIEWPEGPAPTPEARERALLDFAWRQEAADPGSLVSQLREIAGAEARYHEANLLLAGGHGYEALELLDRTSRGDFSQPYFLPGYLLARLGQVRDLAGKRDSALRAYRGVLALDFAPPEAVEAARAGLEHPFTPE